MQVPEQRASSILNISDAAIPANTFKYERERICIALLKNICNLT